MKEDSVLNAFKERFLERQQALREARQQQEDLTRKYDSLNAMIPNFKRLTADVAEDRRVALDFLVLEKISQVEFDEKQAACDDAQKTEKQAEEMLAAITRNQKRIIESIPKLQESLMGARHELWQHIMKTFKAALSPSFTEFVEKVWCAALESGGAGSYEFFLRTLFPQPSIERIVELSNELKQDFGVEENV